MSIQIGNTKIGDMYVKVGPLLKAIDDACILKDGNLTTVYSAKKYFTYDTNYEPSIKVIYTDGTIEYFDIVGELTLESLGSKRTSIKSCDIGSAVTSIGNSTFAYCDLLINVTIPDSVERIGMNAFSQCVRLTNMTIPNGVKYINDYVFYNCNMMTSVTIHSNVTNICLYAFYGCSSLTNIIIPAKVTAIGQNAFLYCNNLTVTFKSKTQDLIDAIANCYWGLNKSQCIPEL